ncbi:MAG: radical SAM family heme chaperone HemW [Acidobacteria bacterium]|nr:radical SAM family heme chaperone HemW [Acidobacteriota bacterium]
MNSPGLYIHIPFCSSICNYCTFTRGLYDADLKRRYVEALLAEIRRVPQTWPAITSRPAPDTLYLGGGTPSLLEPEEVARIVETCAGTLGLPAQARLKPGLTTGASPKGRRARLPASAEGFGEARRSAPRARRRQPSLGPEITLEANPETVTPERLLAFRDAGVNRLSFGAQSFRDEELARLGRLHDAERARDALRWAREAGFDNVSLDLMMWLPQQSVLEWLASVDELLALRPDHASLYLLEVYPHAPLRDEMLRGGWSQAPDEDAAVMYEEAMSRLEAGGFEQYEISNVALPGKRARHNMKYWCDGEWLAFGCGAHGTLDSVRWKNITSTDQYIARVEAGESVVADRRTLTRDERVAEALFMGLRLSEGVDVRELGERYGGDLWAAYGRDLAPHLEAGLVRKSGDRLQLTKRGMLLANEVMSVFV